jgi:hypothetical protein
MANRVEAESVAAPGPATAPPSLVESIFTLASERSPEGLSAMVTAALEHPADPEVRSAVVAAAGERQFALFKLLLSRAVKEPRDIRILLENAAGAVGQRNRKAEIESAVCEIANRECCLRRSFLAAALNGLVEGSETTGDPAVLGADGSGCLDRLLAHPDAELAAAARRAQAHFTPRAEAAP